MAIDLNETDAPADAAEVWVVTYRLMDETGLGVAEFFRGSEIECRRIAAAFAPGGSDMRGVRNKKGEWTVIIGPAAKWDEFLRENS